MTYLTFHLLFILPPILLLAAAVRPRRNDALLIAALCAIALVYTTPWDNYLVYRNVWDYGPDRVLGTIGYVPVEEYLFFVLQPILTGLVYIALADRLPAPLPSARPSNRQIRRYGGATIGLIITGLGAAALTATSTTYLGLILVWSGPVFAGQWFLFGERFLSRSWLAAILLPTMYLWIADRVAIGDGIWSISDTYTIGLEPFGLPIEEAVFFLMTNVLVVQGIMMFRGDERAGRGTSRGGFSPTISDYSGDP